MRRLVAVMVLVALAFTLVACGGGGDDAPAEGEAAAPAPAPASTASNEDEDERPDYSPVEEEVFTAFPTDAEVTPQVILDRLEAGQPMLIYFYDDAQSLTTDQSEAVDAVMADYRGLIDLVSFNLGKYSTTDEEGKITIDPDLLDDEVSQQVSRLIGEQYLDIRYTPFFIFVNEDGMIVARIRGPVDNKMLERQVLRATE